MLTPILEAIGLLVVVCVVLALAPARTRATVDTAAGKWRVEVRPLWGMMPPVVIQSKSRLAQKHWFFRLAASLRAAPRLVHAMLLLPDILPVLKEFLVWVQERRPTIASAIVRINLVDDRINFVIGMLADLPGVIIGKRDFPGADLDATFVFNASPVALLSMQAQLKNSPPLREFFRRLEGETIG